MSDHVWIELLSRRGDVLARHRFDALPIRIGRGYGNDLILDDDEAADEHFVVERSAHGGLVIRSVADSGLEVVGQRKSVRETQLVPDTVIRIGRSRFRVRTSACRADAARPSRIATGCNVSETHAAAFVPLFLAVAVMIVGSWMGNHRDPTLGSALSRELPTVGLALCWIAGWALASQAFRHSTDIGRHMRVAGCVLLVHAVLVQLLPVVLFAANLEAPFGLRRMVDITAFGVAIFLHLRVMWAANEWRLDLAYAGVLGVVLLAGWHLDRQKHEMNGAVPTMTELYPVSWHLTRPKAVADFLGRVRAMEPNVLSTLKEPLPNTP